MHQPCYCVALLLYDRRLALKQRPCAFLTEHNPSGLQAYLFSLSLGTGLLLGSDREPSPILRLGCYTSSEFCHSILDDIECTEWDDSEVWSKIMDVTSLKPFKIPHCICLGSASCQERVTLRAMSLQSQSCA